MHSMHSNCTSLLKREHSDQPLHAPNVRWRTALQVYNVMDISLIRIVEIIRVLRPIVKFVTISTGLLIFDHNRARIPTQMQLRHEPWHKEPMTQIRFF